MQLTRPCCGINGRVKNRKQWKGYNQCQTTTLIFRLNLLSTLPDTTVYAFFGVSTYSIEHWGSGHSSHSNPNQYGIQVPRVTMLKLILTSKKNWVWFHTCWVVPTWNCWPRQPFLQAQSICTCCIKMLDHKKIIDSKLWNGWWDTRELEKFATTPTWAHHFVGVFGQRLQALLSAIF